MLKSSTLLPTAQGAVAMSFSVARRFIFAAKKVRAINVITGISILGIITGVATICIVLSVLNGFRGLVGGLFRAIDNDVQLVAASGKWVTVPDSLLSELRRVEGVRSASRFIEGKVVLATGSQSAVVILKGIDSAAYLSIAERSEIRRRPLEAQSLNLGYALADRLNLRIETPFRLLSPEAIDDGLSALYSPLLALTMRQPARYRVNNLFATQRTYDENYVIGSLESASEVFRLTQYSASNLTQHSADDSSATAPAGGAIRKCSGIDIRASENVPEEELRRRVENFIQTRHLAETLKVETLSDKHAELFRVMALEKWGSFAVLMLIVLVASLSLIGSLSMTAIEKKRELYFLYCVGLEARDLRRIFIIEGALIGTIGTAIGLGAGFLICYAQQQFGVVQLFNADDFIIKSYPVEMHGSDFGVVAGATVIVTLLASLYPASRAAIIKKF